MFKTLTKSLLATKSLEARRLFVAQLRYLQLTAVCGDDSKEKLSARQGTQDEFSARKTSKAAPVKRERDSIKSKEIVEESLKVKKQEVLLNEDLRKAAVRVARSLPGDWTKTADELLARLQMHSNPESSDDQETKEEKPSSLLSTMKVSRSASVPLRHRMSDDRQKLRENKWQDQLPYTITEAVTIKQHLEGGGSGKRRDFEHFDLQHDKINLRKRLARHGEKFSDLYDQPKLGIFETDKIKAAAEPVVKEELDLWKTFDEEKLRTIRGGIPLNAFEEMIQWTKESRLWQFPIDNEADMHEERKYKFHEHVFLEQHLWMFPDKGPIRKFMELIALGLSLNPYITVSEKMEHIRWYAEYFREKQSLLETVVGEQGRMKEGKDKDMDKI